MLKQRAGSRSPADGISPLKLSGVRVLVYGMNYSPEFTSTGRYSGEIGAELARLGAQVEVVTAAPHYPGWRVKPPYRNRYMSERIAACTVHRCPLYLAPDVRGFARLLAPLSFAVTSLPVALWRLAVGRPHVLYCIEPTLFPAPAIGVLARIAGVRAILHVQDLEIDAAFEVGHLKGRGFLRKLGLLFERISLRLFDRVVTISENMRRRLSGKGVPDEKLAVIRNWVDLEQIRPLPDATAYRRVLDLPDNRFIVLYSGNMGAKQALDVIGEAAELLDDSKILFVLAGDGPERQRLQRRFGHLANIRFCDFQPEERLCEFLNMPDVHIIPQLATNADFALPSKLGGILASGRPVLITASEGQELGLFLKDAAIIVPPEDPAMLAQSLRTLAASRADARRERRLSLAAQLSRDAALDKLVAEVAYLARPHST